MDAEKFAFCVHHVRIYRMQLASHFNNLWQQLFSATNVAVRCFSAVRMGSHCFDYNWWVFGEGGFTLDTNDRCQRRWNLFGFWCWACLIMDTLTCACYWTRIFDPQRVWRSAQNGGRQREHVEGVLDDVFTAWCPADMSAFCLVYSQKKKKTPCSNTEAAFSRDVYSNCIVFQSIFFTSILYQIYCIYLLEKKIF